MKKILKTCAVVLATFLIILVFILAIGPSLLSTTVAQEFCLGQINKRIPGKIAVGSFTSGWTSGFHLQDLEVKDPEGRIVIACQEVKLSDSIFSLLFSPKTFGHLRILKPTCTFFADKSGSFSIERTFAKPSEEVLKSKDTTDSAPFIPYLHDAAIEQGSLQIVADNMQESSIQESSIQDFTLNLHLQGLQTADFSLSATIQQGNNPPGKVEVTGKATDLRSLKKSYQHLLFREGEKAATFPLSDVSLDCKFIQFPVPLADSFLGIARPELKGLLQDALGNLLDVTVHHHLTNEQLQLSIALQCPTLTSKLLFQVEEGQLAMPTPAELRWEIKPATFEKLSTLAPAFQQFKLLQPTVFEASIKPTQVALPIFKQEATGNQFATFPLELRFGTQSPLQLLKKEIGALQLNLTGSVDAASLFDKVASKIRLSIGQGPTIGMVESDIVIQAPFSELADAQVKVGLHGAWPALLDQLQLTKELAGVVGKEIHSEITVDIPKLRTKLPELFFTSQLTSQAITYTSKGSLKGNQLTIGETNLTYDLLPLQLQKFTKIALLRPLKALFNLEYLHADLTQIDLQNLEFKGAFTIEPFELNNVPQLGSLEFKKTRLAFEQAKKSDIQLTQETQIALPALKEAMTIQGKTVLSTSGIGTSRLEGTLQIGNIVLKSQKKSIEVKSIDAFQVNIPYSLDYSQNELTVAPELRSSVASLLKSTLKISNFGAGKDPQITSKGKFQNLPISLLGAISEIANVKASQILGEEVSGDWEVNFLGLKAKKNILLANLAGKDLTVAAAFQMSDEKIGAAGNCSPLLIKTTITPARASALFTAANLEHITLKENCQFEFVLKRFELPLSLFQTGTKIAELLDSIDLDASLHLSESMLSSSRGKSSYRLPALDGSLLLAPKSRVVTFGLENRKNDIATEIVLKAVLKNMWNETALTPEKSDIQIESRLKNLPVDCIQLFTSSATREKISALAGDSIDATLSTKLSELSQGSLTASIDAERIHSNVACSINDGTITLPKPIHIKALITKDAGKTLFQDVNPLLATSISTPHPVEVIVDNRDFRIPLKPFFQNSKDINQLKRALYIPSITIQIGKIRVQKGNTLSTVFSLLGLPDEPESELWLTPIYLQMQNGVITMKRSDTLVDNRLQIASWGIVDLIGDRVDMVIGIPGPSLQNALRLKTIDPNYMLQMPIRGTTSTASLDKTRAVAKIASLRMQQSSSDTQALLGGVLNLVTAVSEPEAPVPAPTTVPFPWQRH